MSLMRELLETPVGDAELLLCYLGQNGFIFRVTGLCFGMDLYLSNSCAKDDSITKALGFPLERALPVLIPPAELDLDLVLATHEHKDHSDPETLLAIRSERTLFGGPWPVLKLFSDLGLPESRCLELNEGQLRTVGPVAIRAVFARHVAGSVGFLVEAGGLRTYLTGDSECDGRLCEVARFSPDIMLVCINGRWGNMSSEEAVEITKRIRPRLVAPTHYDMFTVNSANPSAFVDAVLRSRCGSRAMILTPGRIYRFSRAAL